MRFRYSNIWTGRRLRVAKAMRGSFCRYSHLHPREVETFGDRLDMLELLLNVCRGLSLHEGRKPGLLPKCKTPSEGRGLQIYGVERGISNDSLVADAYPDSDQEETDQVEDRNRPLA